MSARFADITCSLSNEFRPALRTFHSRSMQGGISPNFCITGNFRLTGAVFCVEFFENSGQNIRNRTGARFTRTQFFTFSFCILEAWACPGFLQLLDRIFNRNPSTNTGRKQPAIATAIANKVDKVKGKGLSTEDFTTALKEKLVALPEGAEANYVKSVSDEFTVSAEGKLEVKEIAQAKVTGLPDALAGKVDKVEGKGLSANDYTNEEKEKLGGVEAGANKNLIEIIKLAGAALNISEKAVDIPLAGETAGVVTSSTEENKVAVAEDGSMEVNSLNMNKLVQSEGDTLILDGGNASV